MKKIRIPRLSQMVAIIASLGAVALPSYAASITPITGTGYNFAGIATGTPIDGTASAANAAEVQASTSGTLDGNYDYFATGFESGSPTSGLPTGSTVVSDTNPMATFAIQAASTTAINNVILVSPTSGTANPATPEHLLSPRLPRIRRLVSC